MINGTDHISKDEQDSIGLRFIFRHDVLWWLIGAGVALLLFIGMLEFMKSLRPDLDPLDVSGIFFISARPFYYALVVIAVLLARRSLSLWSWVLSVILAVGFMSPSSFSLSTVLMPNSVLYTVIAMIGLLAAGRLVEYVYARYIRKSDGPRLSIGGWMVYVALCISAALVNSPTFYDFMQK